MHVFFKRTSIVSLGLAETQHGAELQHIMYMVLLFYIEDKSQVKTPEGSPNSIKP